MPTPLLTREACEDAVRLVAEAVAAGYLQPGIPCRGQIAAIRAAAIRTGLDPATVRHRLYAARDRYGIPFPWEQPGPDQTPTSSDPPPPPMPHAPEPLVHSQDYRALRDRVRTLQAALDSMVREEITREAIRRYVLELKDTPPNPPAWVLEIPPEATTTGVPTLLASDWHFGEIVKPGEICESNAFDLTIAHDRVRRLASRTIDLLLNHFTAPRYPGLVLALAGDLLTGDIHDELRTTNDKPLLPTLLDLYGILVWLIDTLAAHFPALLVVAVTGNHTRLPNLRRPQAKERNATSFDWLVYSLLAKHFEVRPSIRFLIPDGPDAHFQIYRHRYLLTHGDQFRGGDGLIGPLGPLTRGRWKKQGRDTSLLRPWDTMLTGHFHQLMQLPNLVVNGSLIGFNEWAFQNNFAYERPAQALWITHPRHGITLQAPVYLDEPLLESSAPWTAWPK